MKHLRLTAGALLVSQHYQALRTPRQSLLCGTMVQVTKLKARLLIKLLMISTQANLSIPLR